MSRKIKDQEQYDVLMKSEGSKPATFEEAIEASGFGKFNVLLMCIAIPCSFVQIIEQVSVSYVVPIAQCDLDLSLHDKGILISVGYIDRQPANFEDAITAAGYGKFNILLIFIVIPCSFAQIVENLGLAYVIPIAQCDLNLSLKDKGVLNSVGYAGMIFSGFVWGYICDSRGRRKVVIWGYLLNSLCYVVAAFSHNFPMLLAARFCAGVMFTGPSSAVTAYLAEFHSTSNRAVVQLIKGMTGSLASILLPLIGWVILPTHKSFFISDNVVLHSWNMFLLVCSVPALMSAIIFFFLPESPKFLMTQGKNKDALGVFQLIHRVNSGKSNCYPIRDLVEEKTNTKSTDMSIKERMTNSWSSVKPLFSRPYFLLIVHVCINACSLHTGMYGLKLWYPQILQSMNDYGQEHGSDKIGMCRIVESLANSKASDGECVVNMDNSSVYINSAIKGAVNLITFLVAGVAVNKLGRKTLLVIISTILATAPILLYFVTRIEIMLLIFPITLAFGSVCGNIMISISLELFPTNFRITAVNMYLTFVRIGSVIGNLVFPYLLLLGCLPLCLFITFCVCVTAILTSLLPSTENKALE